MHAKRAEAMILGLFCECTSKTRAERMSACALADGSHHNASWPLANIYRGLHCNFLGDVNADKRIAAYLLVSGLLTGEFFEETLTCVDWQALYEAEHEQAVALKQNNEHLEQQSKDLTLQLASRNAPAHA